MLLMHVGRGPFRTRHPCPGLACLIFVPVFKTLTGMPPYTGMLFGLGIMWLLTVCPLAQPPPPASCTLLAFSL